MFPLLLAAGDGHVPGAGVDRVLDELGHGLEGLLWERAMIVMAFQSSPILRRPESPCRFFFSRVSTRVIIPLGLR